MVDDVKKIVHLVEMPLPHAVEMLMSGCHGARCDIKVETYHAQNVQQFKDVIKKVLSGRKGWNVIFERTLSLTDAAGNTHSFNCFNDVDQLTNIQGGVRIFIRYLLQFTILSILNFTMHSPSSESVRTCQSALKIVDARLNAATVGKFPSPKRLLESDARSSCFLEITSTITGLVQSRDLRIKYEDDAFLVGFKKTQFRIPLDCLKDLDDISIFNANIVAAVWALTSSEKEGVELMRDLENLSTNWYPSCPIKSVSTLIGKNVDLAALQAAHNQKVNCRNKEFQDQMGKLTATHNALLRDVKDTFDKDHSILLQVIEALQNQNNAHLGELYTTLNATLAVVTTAKATLAFLENTHKDEREAIETAHTQEVERMDASLKDTLNQLQQKHDLTAALLEHSTADIIKQFEYQEEDLRTRTTTHNKTLREMNKALSVARDAHNATLAEHNVQLNDVLKAIAERTTDLAGLKDDLNAINTALQVKNTQIVAADTELSRLNNAILVESGNLVILRGTINTQTRDLQTIRAHTDTARELAATTRSKADANAQAAARAQQDAATALRTLQDELAAAQERTDAANRNAQQAAQAATAAAAAAANAAALAAAAVATAQRAAKEAANAEIARLGGQTGRAASALQQVSRRLEGAKRDSADAAAAAIEAARVAAEKAAALQSLASQAQSSLNDMNDRLRVTNEKLVARGELLMVYDSQKLRFECDLATMRRERKNASEASDRRKEEEVVSAKTAAKAAEERASADKVARMAADRLRLLEKEALSAGLAEQQNLEAQILSLKNKLAEAIAEAASRAGLEAQAFAAARAAAEEATAAAIADAASKRSLLNTEHALAVAIKDKAVDEQLQKKRAELSGLQLETQAKKTSAATLAQQLLDNAATKRDLLMKDDSSAINKIRSQLKTTLSSLQANEKAANEARVLAEAGKVQSASAKSKCNAEMLRLQKKLDTLQQKLIDCLKENNTHSADKQKSIKPPSDKQNLVKSRYLNQPKMKEEDLQRKADVTRRREEEMKAHKHVPTQPGSLPIHIPTTTTGAFRVANIHTRTPRRPAVGLTNNSHTKPAHFNPERSVDGWSMRLPDAMKLQRQNFVNRRNNTHPSQSLTLHS